MKISKELQADYYTFVNWRKWFADLATRKSAEDLDKKIMDELQNQRTGDEPV